MVNCFDEVAIKAKELLKTDIEWRARYKEYASRPMSEPTNQDEQLIDSIANELKNSSISTVSVNGVRLSLRTPLNVDGRDVRYNKDGDLIDIICTLDQGGENRLCVLEVRNETTSEDPPKRVIKKAIGYAVFIRELLRSESGNDWYKIFGLGDKVPSKLQMLAGIAMPHSETIGSEFEHQEISLGKDDKLTLHSAYYNKTNGKITIQKTSLK